ncbi:MAG: hypothetical protein CXZ00_16145 [Acidobacteria bacterium]|nr:MAG: hypothetical protein CXZ00_16145 [Acidobacteriota bacterium]
MFATTGRLVWKQSGEAECNSRAGPKLQNIPIQHAAGSELGSYSQGFSFNSPLTFASAKQAVSK